MANAAATTAAESTHPQSGGSLAQAVDRWIYVFMAASFVLSIVVKNIVVPPKGFVPCMLVIAIRL